MHAPGQEQPFPDTRWTLVGRAADRSTRESGRALEELLERYWPALRTHLVRAKHLPADQAEDLVQSFIADKILLGDLLARADRDRGKFRTLLLTALDRYAISVFRKDHAERRSPGPGRLISFEAAPGAADHAAPGRPGSTAFDMAWIQELIHETLRRVERDCAAAGRHAFWALFEDRVVNPILNGQLPDAYGPLVARLGFTSPMKASNALVTVKRMFERTFRAVVREYAGDEDNVKREIQELRSILADASAYL
ncbi:MAG TPA: hypothetical protein PKE12_02385 [Kiritimatiellia bacterium]|nr:hypothetical protein [Kiritimatiellia bacterium]